MTDILDQSGSAGKTSQPFVFEGAQVRVVTDAQGEPWFNANDVCEALQLGNARQALESHVFDDDVQKLDAIDSLGRTQRANHVNESGLYALIFGSTKDAAKRFKRWVTHEVLPAIKKTGRYELQPQFSVPQTLPEALRLAADLAEQKAQAEAKLALAAPKAEALDRIALADGSMCITNAAKVLGVQPKRLFQFLQDRQWIYRRAGGSGFIGYQNRIQVGYLDHKVTTVERSDGSEKVIEQVLVTPKGLTKLAQELAPRLEGV